MPALVDSVFDSALEFAYLSPSLSFSVSQGGPFLVSEESLALGLVLQHLEEVSEVGVFRLLHLFVLLGLETLVFLERMPLGKGLDYVFLKFVYH